MTAEDRVNGWWEAPAADTWTCPECGTSSPVERWEARDAYCEDCGDHDGRVCPACGETLDVVFGAPRILAATNPDVATAAGIEVTR
jgi:ssDNA-binding Zn-finger/Zn-ribbon topoisomerase 1